MVLRVTAVLCCLSVFFANLLHLHQHVVIMQGIDAVCAAVGFLLFAEGLDGVQMLEHIEQGICTLSIGDKALGLLVLMIDDGVDGVQIGAFELSAVGVLAHIGGRHGFPNALEHVVEILVYGVGAGSRETIPVLAVQNTR